MTDLPSQQKRILPDPTVTRIYRVREHSVLFRYAARELHKWLMAHLPPLGEASQFVTSPRAMAQLQWQRAGDILVVRTRSDLNLEIVGNDGLALLNERSDTVPTPGTVVSLAVARQYTPRVEVDPAARALLESLGLGHEADKTRAKPVPVPEDRLEEWARSLVARHLGDVVKVSAVKRGSDVILSRRHARRERVPAAQITATVTDACIPGSHGHTLLAERIATGLGRARNYGLGMIIIPG